MPTIKALSPLEAVNEIRNNNNGQVVLVLQGGGALGAYQGGVYQALHEKGVEPDWIIGTSIGAINAGIIAGNKPEDRFPKLKEFWQRVERADEGIPVVDPGIGVPRVAVGVRRDLPEVLRDPLAPPPGRRLVDEGGSCVGIPRALAMQLGPVTVHLDERLLHEVLGPTDVAGEQEADPHEPGPLARHELGECRLVVSVHVLILTSVAPCHPRERDLRAKG